MNFRAKRWRTRDAFTLIEAILALMVVGMLAATALPSFIQAERAVKTAHHREIATQAAHEALEGWRQAGFAGLPAIPNGQTSATATFTPPSALPGATGTVTFTRVDTAFAPDVLETGRREVVTTVKWAGTSGDTGTVTQATLIVNLS